MTLPELTDDLIRKLHAMDRDGLLSWLAEQYRRQKGPLMPEAPDFDQIARSIFKCVIAELDNPSLNFETNAVVEQLRQVWNARGAADIASIDTSIISPAHILEGLVTALRALDR